MPIASLTPGWELTAIRPGEGFYENGRRMTPPFSCLGPSHSVISLVEDATFHSSGNEHDLS
jgi:hypothetical protein